ISQTRTVLSSLPEASVRPSALNDRLLTDSVWPVSRSSSPPSPIRHRRIVPLLKPAASVLPSVLKAILTTLALNLPNDCVIRPSPTRHSCTSPSRLPSASTWPSRLNAPQLTVGTSPLSERTAVEDSSDHNLNEPSGR